MGHLPYPLEQAEHSTRMHTKKEIITFFFSQTSPLCISHVKTTIFLKIDAITLIFYFSSCFFVNNQPAKIVMSPSTVNGRLDFPEVFGNTLALSFGITFF